MSALKVSRVVEHPNGDGSKLVQVGTVTENGGKLKLLVHGLAAVGQHARPKTFKDRAALTKDGWEVTSAPTPPPDVAEA